MITNRTQYDVDTAISIRKNKVQKFQELTESDINYLERGTLTINTLNRIENKQDELSSVLNSYGYKNIIYTKRWNYEDVFDEINLSRLLDNMKTFYNVFVLYKNTPLIPLSIFSFQELNDVEKFLVDLESILEGMISSFLYSGNEYNLGGI